MLLRLSLGGRGKSSRIVLVPDGLRCCCPTVSTQIFASFQHDYLTKPPPPQHPHHHLYMPLHNAIYMLYDLYLVLVYICSVQRALAPILCITFSFSSSRLFVLLGAPLTHHTKPHENLRKPNSPPKRKQHNRPQTNQQNRCSFQRNHNETNPINFQLPHPPPSSFYYSRRRAQNHANYNDDFAGGGPQSSERRRLNYATISTSQSHCDNNERLHSNNKSAPQKTSSSSSSSSKSVFG